MSFGLTRFDGDITLLALPKQNDILIEVGYLITALRLTPVLQFAHRGMVDLSKGDETRFSLGAN